MATRTDRRPSLSLEEDVLRGGQGRVPLSPAAALPRPPGTGVFGFVSLISFSETVVLFFLLLVVLLLL